MKTVVQIKERWDDIADLEILKVVLARVWLCHYIVATLYDLPIVSVTINVL